MKDFGSALLAIVGGAFSLAIISVLVSKNAQTGTVATDTGSAVASIIKAAVSPVTGGASSFGSSTGNTASQLYQSV